LLDAAINRRPYSQQRLGREASRYARRISNALARGLPDDLHEDIFHEAFANLLASSPAAAIGTSYRKDFRGAVLAAIRKTKSNYAAPGSPTRSSREPLRARVAAEDVDRIPNASELRKAIVADGEHRSFDLDQFTSTAAAVAIEAMETRIDASTLMARAPAIVRDSLSLIYLNGESLDVAAASVNLTRFALHRRIEGFCAPLRLVA